MVHEKVADQGVQGEPQVAAQVSLAKVEAASASHVALKAPGEQHLQAGEQWESDEPSLLAVGE